MTACTRVCVGRGLPPGGRGSDPVTGINYGHGLNLPAAFPPWVKKTTTQNFKKSAFYKQRVTQIFRANKGGLGPENHQGAQSLFVE